MVVDIVGRSNFQTSRTKLHVNIVVFDDRNFPAYQRHDDMLAMQPFVLFVVRIDAHRRVAHDSFWSCCRNYGIALWLFNDMIAQIIQLGMFFLVYNFLVRQCSKSLRIPVHHARTAIDKPFVVQIAEHLYNTFRTFFVHSECRSVPVAACS